LFITLLATKEKPKMSQDFAHYDAVIADLEARRDQLNTMIDTLKQMMSVGLPIATATASAVLRPSGELDISHDAFFGMTIPDAARKYLAMAKRTSPHPDLCDALLHGGFKTSSPNFREVVRSTLGRQADFVKVNGQWGLAEWYPGRGGGRKARRNSSEGSDSDSSASEAGDSEAKAE
jgi:hypothetical protein